MQSDNNKFRRKHPPQVDGSSWAFVGKRPIESMPRLETWLSLCRVQLSKTKVPRVTVNPQDCEQ
jgi:hypothetical protein